MTISVDLMTVARKVVTLETYAASGTDYWQSTTDYRVTCPAGKRIFILHGVMNTNVSSTRTITVKNAANSIIQSVHYLGAGTGTTLFPDTVAVASTLDAACYPIILDQNEYIQILFGSAQDTSSWAAIWYLEVDIK